MRAYLRADVLAVLAVISLAQTGFAAQFNDPDWPCIQPRVPELSMGQMWSGPLPEGEPKANPELEALARHLAPRRVSVDEIAAAAGEALQGVAAADRDEWVGELFAAILDRVNGERGEVMSGIGRYATRQREMSNKIDALADDLDSLNQAETGKDLDRIEELQDNLAWERRVYKDRAQSLSYVCETPVLLEKRAFSIGRALAGLL